MEMSKTPLRLTAGEENASYQVLKMTSEALQTTDQSEEKDVWFMEEGDDSVFYSDEDQDVKSNITCDFGANMCNPSGIRKAGEEHPGAEENLEMGKEVTPDNILAQQELQTPKTHPIDKEAEATLTHPEEKIARDQGKNM